MVVLNNPDKLDKNPLSNAQNSAIAAPANSPLFVVALISIAIIGALSTDIIVPAVPTISQGLGIGDSSAQLVIPLFLAGYALAQIPYGLMADRLGRRKLLLCSLVLFCVASLLCVISSNLSLLLCARFLQGVAAAGCSVVYKAIARDTHAGHDLARLMSLLVSAMSTVTLVSPIIGGVLASSIGWQAVFMVITGMGLLALVLSWKYVPETLNLSQPSVSAATSAPITEAFKYFFASHQSVWATVMLALVFFGFMAMLGGFGTALAKVYEQPLTKIGPLLSSVVVFFVASSMLSQRMVIKTGSMALIKTSINFFAVSGLAFTLLVYTQTSGVHYFLLAILPYACGLGLLFPNASSLALAPQGQIAGLASSIIGTVQMLGAFLGSATAAALYQGDITNIAYPMIAATIALILVFIFYKPRQSNH